jgi:hypothetical protein
LHIAANGLAEGAFSMPKSAMGVSRFSSMQLKMA